MRGCVRIIQEVRYKEKTYPYARVTSYVPFSFCWQVPMKAYLCVKTIGEGASVIRSKHRYLKSGVLARIYGWLGYCCVRITSSDVAVIGSRCKKERVVLYS